MTERDRARKPSIPRLALRPEEVPDALGVSAKYWREYIKPELRGVRRGRITLYPVSEIERWLEVNAARTLDEP